MTGHRPIALIKIFLLVYPQPSNSRSLLIDGSIHRIIRPARCFLSEQTPITEPENGTTENVMGIFEALNKLEYQPYTCDGLAEYLLYAADGTVYSINLSEKWVWRGFLRSLLTDQRRGRSPAPETSARAGGLD